jgi:hypothetical protein
VNTLNLTIVFITIGVVVVACLTGLCSLIFGKRNK